MDVEGFASLLTASGRAAVDAAVAGLDAGAEPIGLSTRLRRDHSLPPDVCAAALTQAGLRRRGRSKFGEDADRMWFTPDGLEQSTRASVARHRAHRFGELAAALRRPPAIADLCCGIGADLLALAGTPGRIVGVDRDPLTAAVARANVDEFVTAGMTAEIVCGDVADLDLSRFDAAFIDPSRRHGGRRTFDVRAYSPGWQYVTELLDRTPSAAKIAPGIPHEVVPPGIEIEWVSDRGDLKEAVLWSRHLAANGVRRRATLLPSGATLSATGGSDQRAAASAPSRYLYEPDPAVVRAHLIGTLAADLDARLLDPSTAYLTADTLVASPFARAFEIAQSLPFSLKVLRAVLRRESVGSVTIMKRGSAVDVEQLRRDLRLSGDRHAVIVLALVAGRHQVLIAQPVVPAATSP